MPVRSWARLAAVPLVVGGTAVMPGRGRHTRARRRPLM
jgi:hypothetical protein